MHIIIPEGESPLYQRLAEAIEEQIRTGALLPHEKLPTVRELSQALCISGGTVRHAYAQLTAEGYLSVTQGRGTFVCEHTMPGSREMAAMEAISRLFSELSALRFTPREMGMFIQLKLRALDPQHAHIPVAVVERSEEMLGEMAEQLSALRSVELMECLLKDVRSAAPDLFARYALIITTSTHYHELASLLPSCAGRIVRAVLAPRPISTIAIARIEPGSRIGVYCKSRRFFELVCDAVHQCPHLRAAVPAYIPASEENLAALTDDLDVLLVAPDYLSIAGEAGQRALQAFADKGKMIIPYHHQIDQGSYMQIEDALTQITARN